MRIKVTMLTLINKYKADQEERLIVAIALANYFKPEMFDRFLIKNKSLDQNFTEFGGKKMIHREIILYQL